MKKTTPKKKCWPRGGIRPGAGRPELGDERMVNVGLSLPADMLAKVDEFAAESGITNKRPRQEALRILINAGLKNTAVEKS